MRQLIFRNFIQIEILAIETERAKPLQILFDPIVHELGVFSSWRNEILHLHLFELTRPQDEVSRSHFVAKRLTNLRDTKRQFAPHGRLHIQKVDEYALGGFGSQIGQRRRIIICNSPQLCLQHGVERAGFGPIAGATRRALLIGDLVGSKTSFALAAINQPIIERGFVARVLPNETIENDRGVEALNIVAFIDQPAPPCLFDVVTELDAEWTIVPGAAEAAVNFGRGENKTSPLGERNDSVDVWCRHEYRIIKNPGISKTLRKISRGFMRITRIRGSYSVYLLGV